MTINNSLRHKNQGLALISVLLIFAIVSVLATAMIERQALDIQRASNFQLLQQARAYTKGVEDAARLALKLDYDNGKEVDHPGEQEWAEQRTFPFDPKDPARGGVTIKIQDAQGRFNLNNLSSGVSNRSDQIQRFRNLLSELGLEEAIAQRTADFMDPESQVDNDYQSLEPPYRTSQKPFKHPSELLLVDGVDTETYKKLEPYIIALPSSAGLNVNTASDYVLSSLATQLTLSDGQQIANERGEEGFSTVDEFWGIQTIEPYTKTSQGGSGDENQGNQNIRPWDKADFSVNSEYFEVFATVEFYGRKATIEFLLYRNNQDGSFRTYYRDYSRRNAREPIQQPTPGGVDGIPDPA